MVRARSWSAALALAVGALLAPIREAHAQAEPFIGQLMLVAYDFCPQGWLDANGQLLPINQNATLFSVMGVRFGGDGISNFALPDLRSRVPVGQGQGPGLPAYFVGQVGGQANVTLNVQQMPTHSHTAISGLVGSGGDANTNVPDSAALAVAGSKIYATGVDPDTLLRSGSVSTSVAPAGGNQPFSVLNPYLGMRWCVALQGIFPQRPPQSAQ